MRLLLAALEGAARDVVERDAVDHAAERAGPLVDHAADHAADHADHAAEHAVGRRPDAGLEPRAAQRPLMPRRRSAQSVTLGAG